MKIYCIRNSVNGKCYIGQCTRSVELRWKEHKLLNGKCRAIENAIRKYGADVFSIEEIASAESQSELDTLERFWIAKLNTVSPNGYNLSGGGNGAGKMHAETKVIMSALANRPEHLRRLAQMQNRPDVKAKQKASKIERWSVPANKVRYGAAIKFALNRPDVKVKRSASLRAAWAKPENHEKLLARLVLTQTDEAKAKRSASLRKAWNIPGAREQRAAAIRAAKSTPEAKARYAATNALPEVKARRSAGNTGRVVSAETRLKKSIAATGKKRGPYKDCKPRPAMAAYWADQEWKAALLAKRSASLVAQLKKAKIITD